MPNDTIWLADIMAQHDRTVLGFDSDIFLEDKKRALEAMERNQRGEPVAEDLFPKELYAKRAGEYRRGLPSFFLANSFWTISKVLADAISLFDLGRTTTHDVKLFDKDRKTPLPGQHKCFNLCEFKNTFAPEYSPAVRRVCPGTDCWDIPSAMEDDLIAVEPAARLGVDLWRDRKLINSLFMTDPVAQKIKEAGLAKELGLYRCRTASVH